MEDFRKVVWTAIILIALIGIGFGIYYFFFYKKSEEPFAVGEIQEELSEVPTDKPLGEEVERVLTERQLDLDKSDNLVNKLAVKLSSHPQLAVWLKNKDMIRKFVAVIDNIADGMSPRSHLAFLSPREGFEVVKKSRKYYLSTASYSRYNLITEVFESLDTKECAKLYWELKPLIQEAYFELGYPNQDFHDTLFTAVVELLKTPVVEGDILVEKKVVTYVMVDPKLENLSESQKHFLRMGPRNIRKIQEKLREFAQVLGFPENQIPKSYIYVPRRYK
jgi:hypothetical protein